MSIIKFNYQVKFALRNRTYIKQCLHQLFVLEKRAYSRIDVIFCTDDYLLQINKQSLQHNYYTDIITFNYAQPSTPIIGELYISVHRVADNASMYNVSQSQELHRVMLHGCLHLCGFTDVSTYQAKRIRAKEDAYLKLFNL